MAVKNDWWFPPWNTAVREALHHGLEGTPGPAVSGAFDAVFDAVGPWCDGRADIGAAINGWNGLRIDGNQLRFSRPFTIFETDADGGVGPVVAEVFGRLHDDSRRRGGCLFVRAADWRAFVATEGDRVAVLLRSDDHDGLWRVTLTHEVCLNPRVRTPPGELRTCGVLEGGLGGPIVLLYESRRRPRWIRVDADEPGCIVDLRELPAFRETAMLLGDIVRGKRPARDFIRSGMPLFVGDVAGTLSDQGDRRAVLCLALVLRTMVWRHESST